MLNEFEPYDHVMKVTDLLNSLTQAHNDLAIAYEKTVKRLNLVEARVYELKRRSFVDSAERTK